MYAVSCRPFRSNIAPSFYGKTMIATRINRGLLWVAVTPILQLTPFILSLALLLMYILILNIRISDYHRILPQRYMIL